MNTLYQIRAHGAPHLLHRIVKATKFQHRLYFTTQSFPRQPRVMYSKIKMHNIQYIYSMDFNVEIHCISMSVGLVLCICVYLIHVSIMNISHFLIPVRYK